MTTISGGSALGAEPRALPVRPSRGAHPIGLVAPGVIHRSAPELPVAVGLHPRPAAFAPGSSPQGGTMPRSAPATPTRRSPVPGSPPMGPLAVTGLPCYRAIVALDIECSTSRPNPIKGELRNKTYELLEAALRKAGIDGCHHDPFVDRGDGILALIHPVDQAPKALLLTCAVPMLSRLLADYNAGLPQHSRPQRQLRVRVVMHAGEVHYDANGCFGEALDLAFRLLDAARVKRTLREMADPLILVVSGDIYSSVVRHGYDGIDHETFHQLVRVQLAGRRYPGWIHLPQATVRDTVAQLASYRRPA
jgi:hypothetical protein